MFNFKEKFNQTIENIHSLAIPILRVFSKTNLPAREKITPRQFTNILEKHHARPVATVKADKNTTFRIIE